MSTLKDWIKVTRVQTAAVTMLALWAGHIVVEPLDIHSTLILGGVGLGVHIWGFTLNEVEDAEYDKLMSRDTGHPIANGVINKEEAKALAWSTGAAAILLYMIAVSSPLGVIALILSFAHGFVYNRRSKKDWYSNVYLSAWVFLMVIAGALSAGQFRFTLTIIIGAILAIQIFVQVIEGDLKDIKGPEATLAETFGVTIDEHTGDINYPIYFTSALVFWKGIEAVLVYWLIIQSDSFTGITEIFHLALFILMAIAYGQTLRGWLVDKMDRDNIKEQSSKHEIVSILFIAVGLMGFDIYGSILVGLIPILWYVVVNSIVHKGSLNPDI